MIEVEIIMDWFIILLIQALFWGVTAYSAYRIYVELNDDKAAISKVLVTINCLAGLGLCIWYTCTINPNRQITLTTFNGEPYTLLSLIGMCIAWGFISLLFSMLPAIVSTNVSMICAAKRHGIKNLKRGYTPPGMSAGLFSSYCVSSVVSAYALMLFSYGLIDSVFLW